MAYDPAYLGNITYAGSKGAAQMYILDTVDSEAAVLAAAYVSDGKLRGMTKGDPVLVRFFDVLPAKTTYLGQRLMSVSALGAAGTTTASLSPESEAVAVTSTVDGLTTGLVPAGAGFITITSSAAGNFVNLPTPYAGLVIEGRVTANGCKIRGPAGTTMNAVANPAALSLAAGSFFRAVGESATEWLCTAITSVGAVNATNVPA